MLKKLSSFGLATRIIALAIFMVLALVGLSYWVFIDEFRADRHEALAEAQSSASEEFSRNVESIRAVTRRATEGANQAASAAIQRSQKAEQFRSLDGRFKAAARA